MPRRLQQHRPLPPEVSLAQRQPQCPQLEASLVLYLPLPPPPHLLLEEACLELLLLPLLEEACLEVLLPPLRLSRRFCKCLLDLSQGIKTD